MVEKLCLQRDCEASKRKAFRSPVEKWGLDLGHLQENSSRLKSKTPEIKEINLPVKHHTTRVLKETMSRAESSSDMTSTVVLLEFQMLVDPSRVLNLEPFKALPLSQ